MTRYLSFPSRHEAEDRNHEIAKRLGCARTDEDVTRFWYSTILNLETGEMAFAVADDEIIFLELEAPKHKDDIVKPADEKLKEPKKATKDSLKTDAELKDMGWPNKSIETFELENKPK